MIHDPSDWELASRNNAANHSAFSVHEPSRYNGNAQPWSVLVCPSLLEPRMLRTDVSFAIPAPPRIARSPSSNLPSTTTYIVLRTYQDDAARNRHQSRLIRKQMIGHGCSIRCLNRSHHSRAADTTRHSGEKDSSPIFDMHLTLWLFC